MTSMTRKEREMQRKLKILKGAEETGHVSRTRRYFSIGRDSFYRLKAELEKPGEASPIGRRFLTLGTAVEFRLRTRSLPE